MRIPSPFAGAANGTLPFILVRLVGALSFMICTDTEAATAPVHIDGAGAGPGLPAWVGRGGATVTHETERALFGVGAAQVHADGDNRALRQEADSKARLDVLRQLDAFAAAVQADNDPIGRDIAVAVQAYRALLAYLVRPRDLAVGSDGTHYVLVALRVESLAAVVGKARDKGLIHARPDAAAFRAAFDRVAHVDAASVSIVAEAQSGGDMPVGQNIHAVPRARGPEPVWGKQSSGASLPGSLYVCGRGHGTSPTAAVAAGAGALRRLLLDVGRAAAQDLEAALPGLGLPDLRHGDAAAEAEDAFKPLQPHLVGQLVWSDGRGRSLAVSCIGRMPGYLALDAALAALDTQLQTSAASAAAAPAGERHAPLQRVQQLLQRRLAMAAMLRAINVSGIGRGGPFAASDLWAAKNPLPMLPTLAVSASGPYWLGLANAVVDGLRGRGVEPALIAVSPTHDLEVVATVVIAPPLAASGQAPAVPASVGKSAFVAQATLDVQLLDRRRGTAILRQALQASGTASTNIFDAERAAVRALAKQAVAVLTPAVMPAAARTSPLAATGR